MKFEDFYPSDETFAARVAKEAAEAERFIPKGPHYPREFLEEMIARAILHPFPPDLSVAPKTKRSSTDLA